MTSLERVSKCLRFEEPDRVPVYPLLAGATRRLVSASYYDWANNADICAEAYIKAAEQFRLDAICTLTDLSVEAADFGAEIIYPEYDAAHSDYTKTIVQSALDYRKIVRIDPR